MITARHAAMTAPLRTSQLSFESEERRSDARQARRDLALLSQAGVERCEAALSDVSPYGCCVAVAGEWLRPGHFVTIALPGMRPLSAIVRWARSGAAGLELLQRLACDEPEWLALID